MRISRRGAGRLLVAYGVVGIALVVVGAIVGLGLASQVERLSGTADEALAAAARATDAAAESFAAVDVSLSDSEASATAAATLAREASASLDELAAAMDVQILGTQPLARLAAEFTTSAEQAAALADTLDGVGGSLGDTRAEVARIAPELEALSEELQALGTEPEIATAAPGLRLFVVLLLVWLVMQALGSVIAGLALLRAPDRP